MSKELQIQPDQQFRAAMRALIGARWRTLWKAIPAAIANEDPEGVHQVRVASRRLRAAMDVSSECFPDKWFRPLQKTAKEITSALGEVRDRDVQLEEFAKQRKRASADERLGIDRLTARIKSERTTAVEEMIRYLTALKDSDARNESKRRFAKDDEPTRIRPNSGSKKKRKSRR